MSTFENTGEFMQGQRWFLSKDLLWFDTCCEGKRINKMSQEENLHVSLEDAFGTSLHVRQNHPWFQLQLLWVSSWEPRLISLCEHPVFSSVWQLSLRSQESLHLELQPSNSLVAQMVKRLPAMLETRDQSLGWEDPLEKEMATHSSTLAWKIPWTEEPGRLQPMGSQRVGQDWATSLSMQELTPWG